MTERVHLNEEQLEDVVGGAFTFYTNRSGKFRCMVDNIGTFYAKQEAFEWVVSKTAGDGMYLDPADVVAEAKQLGLLSDTPFA